MPSLRRCLLPLLAVLTALPFATPGPAEATTTKAYTVSFQGTVAISWSEPRWKQSEDCYDTIWREGSGSQTWNVRSRGVNKVLVQAGAETPQLQFGSWTRNADTDQRGLDAKGEFTRTGGYSTIYTAGTCGAGPQYPNTGPTGDCGTRLLTYEVAFTVWKGEVTPDVTLHGNGVREKTGFDSCTIVVPENVVALSWPPTSGKLTQRRLLAAKKAFTVKGHDRMTGKGGVWNASSTVTVDWTLTFTPASRPAPPKKQPAKHRRGR